MRRYLHGRLSAVESARVEQHLRHCTQCSAVMEEYIKSEEPQNYKQYSKQMKGILASSRPKRGQWFPSVPTQALRAAVAVVVLLVFSFFAVKTIYQQQGDRPLPSEALSGVHKSTDTSTLKVQKKRKAAEEPEKRRKQTQKAEEKAAARSAKKAVKPTPAAPKKSKPALAVSEDKSVVLPKAAEKKEPAKAVPIEAAAEKEAEKPVVAPASIPVEEVVPAAVEEEKPEIAPPSLPAPKELSTEEEVAPL